MTLTLTQLATCFEGVIPSVVATAAADGTPNVSYLSHVVQMDEDRIALSNQFFAKTAANVRANRSAALLLVCPRTGNQYLLDIAWETLLDHGPVFDRIDRALKAAIAQTGMADVMRLKAVDVFRVEHIRAVPSALMRNERPIAAEAPSLRNLSAAIERLVDRNTVEELLDALMRGACDLTGCENALVLLHEPSRSALVTLASTGYAEPGAGSEIMLGEGLIGQAAVAGAAMKISDLSRIQRLGRAALGGEVPADSERIIALPQLPGAMSQIAVPMSSRRQLLGVLFLESERRLAFDDEMAAGLEALARQAASALGLIERQADERLAPGPLACAASTGPAIAVKVHRFDGSVFIDGRYVIKGVAGRLLVFLLERAVAEGRMLFTNREIRRTAELRLPEFKDNLESRILLLARRLDDKAFPVRLLRPSRGTMVLQIEGQPVVEYAD